VKSANDTVCLAYSDPQADAFLIIGTGYNVAFIDGDEIINTESGGFTTASLVTKTGLAVDQNSDNTGSYLFEKEVSGGNLYQHYNLLAEELGIDLKLSNTGELSEVGQTSGSMDGLLAQIVFERSASLVAAQLAGLYLFKERPQHIRTVAEGSVFSKGWRYREMVAKYLDELDVPAGTFEFIEVPDSSLVGAARLMTGR
jgi:hexokinase